MGKNEEDKTLNIPMQDQKEGVPDGASLLDYMQRQPYPEEVELARQKKKNKRLKLVMCILLVPAIAIGWFLGTMFPIGGQYSALNTNGISSDSKIEAVKDLMETEWFFADEIEDLDTRLVDQALEGMTDNEEDPHTAYMSADELSAFTQSINRSFVGIGVSFRTIEGMHVIQQVYKNSPAEKAGVKAGDIISAVDGVDVSDQTADEVKELCTGEEGTDVTITFIRNAESIELTITRGEVSTTSYGYLRDDGIAYLKISNFGEGTPDEVDAYLESFEDCDSLILDLRDNGGGYLTALEKIASFFLPDDTVCIRQVFADGSEVTGKTSGGQYENIQKIVILVNENTASAAEALTLALKEQRPDDVTLVGTTTYGKGTAQVTRTFTDGSALKVTTSKWEGPNGTWINGTGITPDEEVYLHDIFYREVSGMEDAESYKVDSVSDAVGDMALSLDYLGYEVDRTDGYFSESILNALKQFESDYSLDTNVEKNGLTKELYQAVFSAVSRDWNSSEDKDTQLLKAVEILKGE